MLKELYKEAQQSNIEVVYFPMESLTAIASPCRNGYVIGIDADRLSTSAHETVCLAHEMGHCKTGSFYNLNSKFDCIGRHEARANAWAYKRLIPYNELGELCELGIREVWEIADYFGVTDEFAHKALCYYGVI